MRGLVPRIHVLREAAKAWMAGSSPAMTTEGIHSLNLRQREPKTLE
jgi:hypothetical protein